MQEGGQEVGESYRKEDKREGSQGSHAEMSRGKVVMQRGGEEGGKSCREEQREGSHAKRRRRRREVMQRGAEGME